jgi:hypothetical protein
MDTSLHIESDNRVNEPVLTGIRPGVDMDKLISVQQLFCRYCLTREGFMLVPLGMMTLQEDGRVTGYHHPNEHSWQPYKYGSVKSDKAFAFFGWAGGFLPSSTWQKTFNGMPVGFYCSEPEMPQMLCLVPHEEAPSDLKIVYVIATCLRFYKKTVPQLIEELLAEDIAPERIKVVVNGCTGDDHAVIDNIDYAFSTHDAYELSALYEAPLRWQFDYAMLIHDTNQIYPGFKRKVENFNTYLPWDHLPATPLARCLLGLYAYSFLLKINDWLKETNGIEKQGAIIAEVAGELLHRAESVLVMGDPEMNGGARQAESKEVADFFNSGTLRIRRVFPTINLHKFTHFDIVESVSL